MVRACLVFVRNRQTVFQSGCPICIPPTASERSRGSTSSPAFVVSGLDFGHSNNRTSLEYLDKFHLVTVYNSFYTLLDLI